MRKILIASTLFILPVAAFAWDNPPAPPVQTNTTNTNVFNHVSAASRASAAAISTAHATGGKATATGGTAYGGASTSSSTGSPVSISNSGNSSGSGLHYPPVASAVPAPIYSANPCGGGSLSGAVQAPWFGVSIAGNPHFDAACQLQNLGYSDVGFAYLCQTNADVRKAASYTAHPCPQSAIPVTSTTDTQVNDWPDWCYTASAGEKSQHYQCNQKQSVTTLHH